MNGKQKSPIAWILGQTGDHGGQYVLSVVLAVISVRFRHSLQRKLLL